ncbi:MAG: hypothetical protein PHV30_00545 [Candidatus Margulisbacteria bacterium]|nr:hypothetical protein [Candidatus Margulisiibacteriota bacterium]
MSIQPLNLTEQAVKAQEAAALSNTPSASPQSFNELLKQPGNVPPGILLAFDQVNRNKVKLGLTVEDKQKLSKVPSLILPINEKSLKSLTPEQIKDIKQIDPLLAAKLEIMKWMAVEKGKAVNPEKEMDTASLADFMANIKTCLGCTTDGELRDKLDKFKKMGVKEFDVNIDSAGKAKIKIAEGKVDAQEFTKNLSNDTNNVFLREVFEFVRNLRSDLKEQIFKIIFDPKRKAMEAAAEKKLNKMAEKFALQKIQNALKLDKVKNDKNLQQKLMEVKAQILQLNVKNNNSSLTLSEEQKKEIAEELNKNLTEAYKLLKEFKNKNKGSVDIEKNVDLNSLDTLLSFLNDVSKQNNGLNLKTTIAEEKARLNIVSVT